MDAEFIIAGWLDYGENRDDVLSHFVVCAAASRDEAGCLDYTVCADPEFDGRVVVYERWESERHLAAHFETPHIAEFRAAVASYPRTGRELRRYFVAHSEDFSSSSSVKT